MRGSYCICAVADGDYSTMLNATVHSARQVGVLQDFHLWTDGKVDGATCHQLKPVNKANYLFKFQIMLDAAKELNYDYQVWLDADTYFVRNPGNLLDLMQDSPVHAQLESDAAHSKCIRKDWWGCPLPGFVDLMKKMGVQSRSIFNVNAGFWIIHQDVVKPFYDLAMEFWHAWKSAGHDEFSEEPPLAYAVQMLCGNPYLHTLDKFSDRWASEWLGYYEDRLPDGKSWLFEDYFRGHRFPVNPAIVHAMRSKKALIRLGQRLSNGEA